MDRKSQWRKVKSKIEKDSRYKVVEPALTREEFFREYIEQLEKVCEM